MITTAATEFADAGRAIALPVACYIGDHATSVQFVVGVGIPVLVVDPLVSDGREDPPDTLRSFAWIRDEIDSLQSEQLEG